MIDTWMLRNMDIYKLRTRVRGFRLSSVPSLPFQPWIGTNGNPVFILTRSDVLVPLPASQLPLE